jgi:hypothetical protein
MEASKEAIMKRKLWMLFPAVLVAALALNGGIKPIPPTTPQLPAEVKIIRVMEVRPAELFAGEFATAYGFNLEAERVKELWLIDGKATFRVEILEQGAHTILFRLPTWIPAGRWQIAVFTDNEMLIEQGVYLRVRLYHGPPTG